MKPDSDVRLATATRFIPHRGNHVLLVCALAVLLGACGFQLRGSAQLPFSSIYVQVSDASSFGHELKRALRVSNTKIVADAASAQTTLVIMSEIREKQILSLGGQGRVREFQLRYRIGYQVTDGKALIITSPTEIMVKRDISFNDNEALAKEAEEAALYTDMQTDAVHQLLRRLQATKLPDLMRLDSEQLPQQLARALAPLYSIVADEPLLALEAGDRLRAHARAAGFGERTLLMAESGFEWGSLAAAGASLSLFAERRLIELRIPNGKPGVAGAEALQRYCRAIPPDTVTIVHLPAVDWRAAQAEWFQSLEHAGVMIEARPVDRTHLPRWLAGRLAQQGQSADDATLQFVADRVEGNLLAAWQEVQKLALLFPAGKLAYEDVRKAVLDVARFDIGNVSDALLAGNAALYVRVLDGLQAEGAALPLVLWALASDLRAAYSVVRALERGVPIANALREARVFGPRRAPMERAAQRWSATQAESALLRCAQIDRMIKGVGRGQPWDELRELGLALITCDTASAGRSRARSAV